MNQRLPVIQPGPAPIGSTGPPVFAKIAIVGLGLVGGSIALAARRTWPASLVIGVDDNDVLERAMVLHAVDVGADDLVIASEAELVILASDASRNITALRELPDAVPGSALVTDVGAAKRDIITAARSLPPRFTFIAGHPLVTDVGDIVHANPDLFKARLWMLMPQPGAPAASVDQLQRFVSGLGAEPRIVEADER